MIQEPANRPDLSRPFDTVETLWPEQVRGLRLLGWLLLAAGVTLTAVHRGLREVPAIMHYELGLATGVVLASLTVMHLVRYRWSRQRASFLREHRLVLSVYALWVAGTLVLLLTGPPRSLFPGLTSTTEAQLAWTDLCMVVRGLAGLQRLVHLAANRETNPAVILAGSFLALIAVGTLLLMLPRARAQAFVPASSVAASAAEPGHVPPGPPRATGQARGAPLLVALFTSTSACCVTGLIVVPTGSYWSTSGQVIILCLFQIGGLGIMTWGAVFALVGNSPMTIGQNANFRELLDSDKLADVRRLLKTILLFTLGTEAVGAVLLSGLWSDEPAARQIFQSVFHSVSAFCNAGFSLRDESFVGWSTRWQIWLVVPLLIVLGGLGFAVALSLWAWLKWRWSAARAERHYQLPSHRARLSLTARMVLGTTAFLLIVGMVAVFLMEAPLRAGVDTPGQRLADAWFQSVTFRTAGFNTVDHGTLQPGTKLLAILLMFIGASPGSTGGGVKTMTVAIAALAVVSVLRSRNRLELFGRSIPEEQVSRALTIIFLGLTVTMVTALLLVVFEGEQGDFLDLLYEATSACATVGVSTGLTAELSTSSQLVLIAAMFLGRVGPLTLLLAVARRAGSARYEYPEERIVLG